MRTDQLITKWEHGPLAVSAMMSAIILRSSDKVEVAGEMAYRTMVIGTAITPEPLDPIEAAFLDLPKEERSKRYRERDLDKDDRGGRLYLGRMVLIPDRVYEGHDQFGYRADQILCSDFAHPRHWHREITK